MVLSDHIYRTFRRYSKLFNETGKRRATRWHFRTAVCTELWNLMRFTPKQLAGIQKSTYKW